MVLQVRNAGWALLDGSSLPHRVPAVRCWLGCRHWKVPPGWIAKLSHSCGSSSMRPFQAVRLFTSPRASLPRELGKRCRTFDGLAVEVTERHCSRTLGQSTEERAETTLFNRNRSENPQACFQSSPGFKTDRTVNSLVVQGLRLCSLRGKSQDGGVMGRGDHFLSYKFIKRTTER